MVTGKRPPIRNRAVNSAESSHAELPQMMIHMFVHSAAPVLRCECAKKWMRMPSTFLFSAFVKLPKAKFELLLFATKIPLVRHD